MAIFPVIAAIVSGVFAGMLIQRWARGRRPAELAWGVALAMYALASLIVAVGVSQGWDATLFKGYWLFGAMLNVPYLALGSVALLGNRVATALAGFAVAAATLFAIGVVATADASREAFVQHGKVKDACPHSPLVPEQPRYDIPRGKCVWGDGSTVGRLGSVYSIPPYLVVVGIAMATSRRRGTVAAAPNRARGNWLIVAGATVVAVGGSAIARLGRGAPFSIALALGAVIMFAGFLVASHPSPQKEDEVPA